MRIRLSLMPDSSRSSGRNAAVGGGRRVHDGGLGIAEVGREGHERVASMTRQASSRPPRTRKDSTPPNPLCCARPGRAPGCVSSPA
jgi:hypothetical protein